LPEIEHLKKRLFFYSGITLAVLAPLPTCTPSTTYTIYPCGIDSSDQLPIAVNDVTPIIDEVINRHREALIAIESELGIQPSGTYTTVRARLDALECLIADIGSTPDGLSTVLNEGVVVRNNVTSMNFIGAGVNATSSGIDGRVNIAISSTGGGTLFQIQESIPVTTNGQTAFTLSEIPQDSTAVKMFVNGAKQEYGTDYIVSGTAVTYSGISLLTTDDVEFWYITSASTTIGQVQETIAIGFNGQTSITIYPNNGIMSNRC